MHEELKKKALEYAGTVQQVVEKLGLAKLISQVKIRGQYS